MMIKSVALYPEYLEHDRLEGTLEMAKAGGVEAIRFGEFAWGLIEPEEGRYQWEVFDRAFALTESLGLKVILCTPTACPPAWLAEGHADILPVNDAGDAIGFGARQHRCYNSPAMRAATSSIVAALAQRYGRKENLYAWQIDNELGAEHKYCYCSACREAFHAFLQSRYETIENLNRRWMSTFWAQNYTDFSQIPLPGRLDAFLPMRHHPSLMYEFMRFSSQSVVDFCAAQAAELRAHSDRIVTSNQDDFYYGDNVDWTAFFANLDVVSFDIYTQRLYELGFYFDMSRNLKNRPFWLLEFGSTIPILADMLDLAHEKGCDLAGLFPFHPFYAGQEHGRAALIDHFDKPMPNYAVFRDWRAPGKPSAPRKRVTLLYDFNSSYAYNAMEYRTWETGFPQIFSRLAYREYLIHDVYKAVFEAGIDVDVVTEIDRADPARPLLLPMKIVRTEAAERALMDFLSRGGRVVATADLFLKDEYNAYHREMPALYRALMGDEAAYADDESGLFTAFALGDGTLTFLPQKADGGTWLEWLG